MSALRLLTDRVFSSRSRVCASNTQEVASFYARDDGGSVVESRLVRSGALLHYALERRKVWKTTSEVTLQFGSFTQSAIIPSSDLSSHNFCCTPDRPEEQQKFSTASKALM